ncbi:MAG: hypothetical protein R6X20_17535 [Phycisphaerae bacterium]
MPLPDRVKSREVIDTPDGKRLRMVETETRERIFDRGAVDTYLANLEEHIAHVEADLAALKAERDDLVAKRDQVDLAPKEGGQAAQV